MTSWVCHSSMHSKRMSGRLNYYGQIAEVINFLFGSAEDIAGNKYTAGTIALGRLLIASGNH